MAQYFSRKRYFIPKGEIVRDYGKPQTGKEELNDTSETTSEE